MPILRYIGHEELDFLDVPHAAVAYLRHVVIKRQDVGGELHTNTPPALTALGIAEPQLARLAAPEEHSQCLVSAPVHHEQAQTFEEREEALM